MPNNIVTINHKTKYRVCLQYFIKILIVILFISIFFTNSVKADATGIVIPLYSYPGPNWTKVINAKNMHPNVPMIAIINPSNGPGSSISSNYTQGIASLKSAGITVLGYTYTGYGTRDPKADIDKYVNWYPLDGIFFDEMSSDSGYESWYKSLTDYSKSKGYSITIGNPGTDTIPSYVGTVDNLMIYESAGFPSTSKMDGWHVNYSKSNWSIIPYGVSTLNISAIQNAEKYVKYMYVTDDTTPNPWDTVATYFETLVNTLAVTAPSPTPQSADLNNDGVVNIIDLGIIIDNYSIKNPNNSKADINLDGIVDIIDIGIAIDNFDI